ncbi:unnamed protein product [Plutella xylostella]|uniref:(diamondback moth) hypothetical protein n=1 Tax=Plutella xylostella TaxID=51655 RepID=A0A8S4FC80_PLUXY|nr:unnamed protein product [Plutella xylostella]
MGASCRKLLSSNGVQAAGSVLDRVISQASSEDNTVLYKLADYKKGGLLLEAYAKGGMVAAEKLIREQFAAYMYAGGRGRVINRAEYLRWKFRDQEQVVLPIEASLSPYDPLAKWEDHMACWQMCYRGALGESLLHVLIICDTKIHTRLARTLVKCYPKLSLDVVEGEEYLGASSLHLAIAYSNNELVQDLVECGADVNQRAIGSFFLPRDQQCNPPARSTNYEGLAYLGEYPLAWAACCANEAVYNLLLDSTADPDSQDSFGNMILHMVVVCDKLDMFGYALRHPKMPASNGRMNKAGFTPLTLACQLGRASVFREMLELSAKEFWRYSNITCSAYPLNALDTLLPDGRTNWNSALFIILNGTKQEHLNMLDGGIIQRLLEEKWKTFARNKFLKRLMILMLHLFLLSISVYLRHSSIEADTHPNWGLEVDDVRSGVRLSCELGTIVSTLCYIILQQGDELKNQGLVAYFKQLIHEPAKFIFLASNLLLLACIPARLSLQTNLEEAILIFVLPGSWFLLMFFAGAVKLTGPFVTMIYSMITGDMFTFGIIYCIILFGFSQSFFFLYKGFPNVQGTLFSSYPSTWMALFQITLGDYSYTDLGLTTYPNLSKTVFAVFMVFVPILLLNMLIAMMGNTYAHVIEQSEKEWVKQWAKIVVSLERSVAQEDAHRYLQEYSIGLGPSDDPRYEQRAVMVIKSKAKTRAKQRKGALTNWKRVGKVTISELRKRGISGEDLRRLMWGRVSISSPTKNPLPKIPPPDCVIGSQTGDTVPGVGSALSSSLGVMTATHQLNLGGTDPMQKLPTPDLLVNGKTRTPTAPGQVLGLASQPARVPLGGVTPGVVPSQMTAPGQVLGQMAATGLTSGQTGVPGLPQGQMAVSGQMVPIRQPVASGLIQGSQVPGITQRPSPLAAGQVVATGMNIQGQFTAPGGTLQVMPPGSMAPGQVPLIGMPSQIPQGQVLGPGGIGQGPMMMSAAQNQLIQGQVLGAGQVMAPGFAGQGVMIPGAQTGFGQPAGIFQGLQLPGPPIPQVSTEVFRDYLLELVILAESKDPKESQLKDLAEKAANLKNVPEIDININLAAKSARKVVAGAMSGLFGVAADAPAPDSWRRDRQDHSDSDPISDTVLLGRASRARRARSASRRAPPPPPHLYVPARTLNVCPEDLSRMRAARPLCIQHATGQVPIEHSVYVVGTGNGAEVESAAPSQTSKPERRKPRPKTARNRRNRVSPVQETGSPLEPWATAPLSRISRMIRSSSASTASLRSETSQEHSPQRY